MRSSSIERLLALRSFPGLRDVAAASIAPMARYTVDRDFVSGEMILEEGSPVTTMHFVLDGQVEISRSGLPFRRIEPGQSFGSLAALAGVQEGVTAQTTKKTRTLELSVENLELVMLEHFDLLTAALTALGAATIHERMKLDGAGYSTDIEEGTCPARDMSLIEKTVSLKDALFISRHRVDALIDLARSSQELRYKAGDVMWNWGDREKTVAHVVCGVISCVTKDDMHFRFGAGAFLGAMDAMTDEGRWFRATAQSDVVVLRFDIDDFIDIIEDHSYMAMELLRGISDDLFTVLGTRRRYASDDSPL
ncbi:MAG: cyclic nucleotide-binding domain-containing protein [Myxococcota bacterium]